MNETREELIARITREVLAALSAQGAGGGAVPGAPRMLVVGDPALVPDGLARGFSLTPIGDYDGEIEGYDKVCITQLNFTELSDIALGRNSRPAQCAVISALLHGGEVLLLEDALAHRALAG